MNSCDVQARHCGAVDIPEIDRANILIVSSYRPISRRPFNVPNLEGEIFMTTFS